MPVLGLNLYNPLRHPFAKFLFHSSYLTHSFLSQSSLVHFQTRFTLPLPQLVFPFYLAVPRSPITPCRFHRSYYSSPDCYLHPSQKLNMPSRRPKELNELPIEDLLNQLLVQNEEFADHFASNEKEHLESLGKGQSPRILWIGCSDSRVSAELATGVSPGHIFVLRNIGNSYLTHDLSASAILSYAIFVLKVEAIIVCGHTNCGGVRGAVGTVVDEVIHGNYPDLSAYKDNIVQEWIHPIKEVARLEIENLPREKITENNDALVERVTRKHIEQTVKKLAQSSLVREARNSGQKIRIFGWEYNVETARLHDLKCEH